MAISAILVAIGSPVLGAIADMRGRLKRLIAALSLGFVAGQAVLWYAAPGATELTWLILLALIVASIAGEFSAVLNNALMPRLVPPDKLGRLSGGGWALGYAGGLAGLVIAAAFILVDPQTGRTMLGLEPVLPLDAASQEPARLIGPFSALWFILFSIPFSSSHPMRRRNPARPMPRSARHSPRSRKRSAISAATATSRCSSSPACFTSTGCSRSSPSAASMRRPSLTGRSWRLAFSASCSRSPQAPARRWAASSTTGSDRRR
ncbi:MAG: hypothetical protein HC850_08160 [Rhodomicrobium sp.]|nr:hypothetical protein [Rhodomicrobium sp.]